MIAESTSVVLLALGRGLRLHSVTRGANKCLTPLDGSKSIASNTLEGVALAGRVATAAVRADDPAAERLLAMDGVDCLVTGEAHGYLHDVARLSVERPDILVIESDIVGAPGEMALIIRALLASPAAYSFTVASVPSSDDPRSIRPVPRAEGGFALTDDVLVPRLCGLYRFRPSATAEMRRFAARGRGTFHDFMEHLAGQRQVSYALVHASIAFNVNWPDDLASARLWYKDAVGSEAAGQRPVGGSSLEERRRP